MLIEYNKYIFLVYLSRCRRVCCHQHTRHRRNGIQQRPQKEAISLWELNDTAGVSTSSSVTTAKRLQTLASVLSERQAHGLAPMTGSSVKNMVNG